MQAISDDLLRILSGRFGAGADGFHSRVTLPDAPPPSWIAHTSPFWATSAIHGITPTITAAGSAHSGEPVDLTDGVQAVGIGFGAEGMVGIQGFAAYAGTYYNHLEFAWVGSFLSLSVYANDLTGAPYSTWEVLADGAVVSGSWTYPDTDGWYVYPIPSGKFHTWRPASGLPVPVASILEVREKIVLPSLLYSGVSTISEILVRDVSFGGLPLNGITRASIDKSLQTDADAFDVECDLGDNDWASWLPYAVPDARIRIEQWNGVVANAVQTFEGFIDTVAEARDPHTVTLSGRCWMKPAITQGAIVLAPQGATEPGAIRTPANHVYLNMEVSAIVTEILTHLDFPATYVTPTSYIVAEYVIPDNGSWAAAFSELGQLVGYRSFCDELGGYHFAPPTHSPAPVAIFRAGGPNLTYPTALDIVSLSRSEDDLELATRVKVIGPPSTAQEAWTEEWSAYGIANPTGVWYDPSDPDNVKVVDGVTCRVYTIRQSDRAIIATSTPITATFLADISGDPGNPLVFWVLDAPWKAGHPELDGHIIKLSVYDHSVLASYDIGLDAWSCLKCDGASVWLGNWTDDKVHKWTSAGGFIASYVIGTFDGGTYTGMTGIAVDGTDLLYGFHFAEFLAPGSTNLMLKATTAAPGTITGAIAATGSTSGIESDSGSNLFAAMEFTGIIQKFKLTSPPGDILSAVVISGVGYVSPEPIIPTGPVETALNSPIRRLILPVRAITSYAQAVATALRQLELVDQTRRVLDAGIVGNPALQKGDVVQIVDPVTDESGLWVIDTYRTEMSGKYLGTLALVAFAP